MNVGAVKVGALKVGAAEIDITPDFPGDFTVELCGFAARVQPSIGVLEPIFARAIYLESGDARLLWIACDVVALGRKLVEQFRAWAHSTLELQPHQVLLCATHTHNAPATIALNAAGQSSERYVALLSSKLKEVACAACGTMTRARLLAGKCKLDLAVDRRNKPSAHVDPWVWALAFIDGNGSRIAAVVNYAMHPVTLGHGERRISPDWCGAAADLVSNREPGAPKVLITNGAAGNLNPPIVDQPAETARKLGQLVGLSAIISLATAPVQSDPMLLVRSLFVPVALDVLDVAGIDRAAEDFRARLGSNHLWKDLAEGVAETWARSMKLELAAGAPGTMPIELQAIRIGDLKLLAVNGEMFSRFTELVRQRVGPDVFVVGYANAAFGYIPTREAYAEGGYEVDDAHFFYNSFRPAIGGLELLADRAVELLRGM